MCCVCRITAVIAAALLFCVSPGLADNGPYRDDPRFLFFAGGDVWRSGGFVHGGLLWSPGGLSQEGFTLKFVAATGIYRYQSGALGNAAVTGGEEFGAVLPGWRFKWKGLDLTVFAGVAAQHDALFPDDVSAGLRGYNLGAAAGFDAWYEPTSASMIAANGFVSSIGKSYSARVAYGWRMFDRFYVGPEIQALGSDNYRQFRGGLHVTGYKTTRYEWSAAAGFSDDSDHRSGAYGRIGVLMRR